MTIARRVAGWKANRKGKDFETFLAQACRAQGIACIRIPDGCRKVFGGVGRAPRLLPAQSPFDYVLGYEGRVCCLDTKNLNDRTLTYSALKQHQVEALSLIGRHCVAGYLVFFSGMGLLAFFSGKKLRALKPRESLGVEDADLVQRMDSIDLTALFSLRV